MALALKGRAFLSDQRLVLLVHSTLPLLEELPMPRQEFPKRKAENLKFPQKQKSSKNVIFCENPFLRDQIKVKFII